MDTQKMDAQKQPGRWAEAAAFFFLFLCLGAAGLHAATQTTSFEPAAATVGNARLLALAVTMYVEDYDERLPDTRTAAAFDAALRPYIPDPAVFTSRVTGKPFIPNAAISGKSISVFSDPSTVALFSDVLPPSRIPATVGFLDGHVERGGVVQLTPNSSYDNAKALALGVIQYTQDYDETYPPMKTQAAFQAAVLPYAKNSRVFIDPANGKPFLPNPALSQVPTPSIADPSQTVLFQSSTPYTNGVPTVAYADGHVTPLPPNLAASPGAQDASQLRQIGLATAEFTQDNDEILPTTTDYMAFENELFPYLRTTTVFTSPGSGLPYVLNPAISGVSYASITDPFSTEEAQDAQLNSDGILNRLQVSGQVRQDFYFLPLALLVTPDDQTHLLWRSAAPQASLWTFPAAGAIAKTTLAHGATITAFSAGADGQTHLLGGYGYGAGISTVAGDGGTLENLTQYGVYDGWTPSLMTTGPDSVTHLLWQRTNGLPALGSPALGPPALGPPALGPPALGPPALGPLVFGSLALWTLSPTNSYQGYVFLPNLPGGTPVGLATGSDGFLRLLWKTISGDTALWMISPDGKLMRQFLFSSPAGQTPAALSVAADGTSRLLWSSGKDTASVQTVTTTGKVSGSLAVSLPGGGTATQIAVGRSGDLRLLWNAADGSGRLQTLNAQGDQTGVQTLTPYL